jgi:hypothetical protein
MDKEIVKDMGNDVLNFGKGFCRKSFELSKLLTNFVYSIHFNIPKCWVYLKNSHPRDNSIARTENITLHDAYGFYIIAQVTADYFLVEYDMWKYAAGHIGLNIIGSAKEWYKHKHKQKYEPEESGLEDIVGEEIDAESKEKIKNPCDYDIPTLKEVKK